MLCVVCRCVFVIWCVGRRRGCSFGVAGWLVVVCCCCLVLVYVLLLLMMMMLLVVDVLGVVDGVWSLLLLLSVVCCSLCVVCS